MSLSKKHLDVEGEKKSDFTFFLVLQMCLINIIVSTL